MRSPLACTDKHFFAAEDARRALIEYLEGETGDTKGPATLIKNAELRGRLRDELRTGKLSESEGSYFLAGFHFSLAGKWYAFKLVGRGFFEDYRGEFEFEGNRWKARPPVLEAIGHFKDKDGFK